MSYLTDYDMMVESCSDEKCLALDAFIETTKVDSWSYLNDVWSGRGNDLTWSAHQVDMGKLSAAFPEVLFVLWGDGQVKLDHWKEYYLDGKCQVAKGEIIYPDFDESQLRSINKECPSCYGEGVLHADGYPSIGCPKCNGEGEVFDG